MNTGTVVQVSRRNATVLTSNNEIQLMRIAAKVPNLTVGDNILWQHLQGTHYVTSQVDRQNFLSRSYRKRTKEIAANVDLICIITAVQPLFNTHFIDRCLVSAALDHIPVVLVINKSDLDMSETKPFLEIYERIGVELIVSNTKKEGGLIDLKNKLNSKNLRTAVLLGVSGVGKSSIINQLIPHARQHTNSVSEKTGQGRQTTSVATGYVYERHNQPSLLLVDLPGIQHFGLTDFSKYDVKFGFTEFVEAAQNCQYSDCLHLEEPICGVKEGLKMGSISLERYESYLNIISEIESSAEF